MGAAAEVASEIATVLRKKYDLEVDVVDLKKGPSPDLERYKNIVIGSGVRMGSWTKVALEFLHKDLKGKRVAVFVSSLMAGDPKMYNEAMNKFIKDVLSIHARFEPVAVEAFGGHLRFLGMTFTDNRDMEKVRAWADELGKKFTQ